MPDDRFPRSVSTVFCDDIRKEVGNKLSFMGVYSGHMYVQEFPVMLPKLCVFIHLVTPAIDPFKSVAMRVLAESEVIFDHPVDLERLKMGAGPDDSAVENQIHKIAMPITFSPFLVKSSMVVRVRADVDGVELRGPALRILQGANAE